MPLAFKNRFVVADTPDCLWRLGGGDVARFVFDRYEDRVIACAIAPGPDGPWRVADAATVHNIAEQMSSGAADNVEIFGLIELDDRPAWADDCTVAEPALQP